MLNLVIALLSLNILKIHTGMLQALHIFFLLENNLAAEEGSDFSIASSTSFNKDTKTFNWSLKNIENKR